MRSVNIARLKDRLSSYLKVVREGEELLIRDRNLPVAKIVPLSAVEGFDADELAMAASGQLRLPEARLPDSFWKMPAPRLSARRAAAAVTAVREEG